MVRTCRLFFKGENLVVRVRRVKVSSEVEGRVEPNIADTICIRCADFRHRGLIKERMALESGIGKAYKIARSHVWSKRRTKRNRLRTLGGRKAVPDREYDLPLRWPLLDFFVLASMQHDLVRMSRGHARVSFRPIVRNGVSEDVAGPVESSRRNRTGGWVESCFSCQNKMS